MLSFLIVLYALCGFQANAFPSRYKRNYEASYHYIPYEEGIVRLPAGYSPENYPNYQDYIHGYVQTNGHEWPVYYHQPVPSQDPYSNVNGHHKIKSQHTWHFIDSNHVPITHYRDGMHQFESGVDAPKVIEAVIKKEVIDEHDAEYEVPIVVEALTRKDNMDHVDAEFPVVVESVTIERNAIGYEHDKNSVETDSSAEHRDVYENKYELPDKMDSLTKLPVAPYHELNLPEDVDSLGEEVDSRSEKDDAVTVEPAASYVYEPIKEKPIKEKPIKEKPIKEKPIKEKPIKEKPIKEKPIKEKPIKEKPIKEKPITTYDVLDYPLGFNSLNEEQDYETPIVVEALIRKEKPNFHMEGEYETPVVVEALVRKHPVYENEKTNTKEGVVFPKDLFHPDGEAILIEGDDKDLDIPVVEDLSLEQDSSSNETPKEESITSDETHGFNEPERDGFDETEDDGSAMDSDGSDFARSFLPVNSNIFSVVTNIKEQERRKFKSCVTPQNETGNCMPFQLCSVSPAIRNIDELLKNVCIIDEVFLGVCCPEFPVETVRVDWEQLKPDAQMLNEEKSSEIEKECGKLPPMVTDQNPWPWMALLIARSSNKIFCGGALIAEQYVLTAAHCTKRIPRNRILVRLGSPTSDDHPEPDFEVIEIKRHAGYNPRTMQNDIALLKLSRRVQLGDFRRVVCLAKDEEGIEGLVSESASLLRWKQTPGEIKDVESLSVISNRECQNKMRTAVADSIICTEPRTDETMCNADSGAPLIISKEGKFEVIGILTWNRNDCDERFPTVFTRVSSYHRWIEKLAS